MPLLQLRPGRFRKATLLATLSSGAALLAACGDDKNPVPREKDAACDPSQGAGTESIDRPLATPYLGLPNELQIGSGRWALVPVFEKLRFVNPVGVYPIPATNHLMVVEQEGRLIAFENDPEVDEATTALDIRPITQGLGDSGLLGIAFHPDFGRPGTRHEWSIFINYLFSENPSKNVRKDADTPTHYRLSRFDYDIASHTIDPDSEDILINQLDENFLHQGGAMFFHPMDGFLYFAVGDEGGPRCRYENCQIINKDLFSGVLRIDVDEQGGDVSHPIPRQPETGTTRGYYIPNDNPFVGEPGVLEEFYALGLRSPHRMTYDPVDNLTWIGDVGQSKREEIDLLFPGANFQWDVIEGTRVMDGAEVPQAPRGHWTPPLLDFNRNALQSIIGGYVYRGTLLHDLVGKYIYTDWGKGTVYALEYRFKEGPLETGEYPIEVVDNELLIATDHKAREDGFTSFGVDHEGELYLTYMGEQASLLRLEDAGNRESNVPRRLSETGLLDEGSFEPDGLFQPVAAFFPYAVNSPLYSDGARKTRFVAVPSDSHVTPSSAGPWEFPPGSVFLKHFDMALDSTQPEKTTRLETRVLVITEDGAYGITYRWNERQTDASLVSERTTWDLQRVLPSGERFVQEYTLPGPTDCMTCHVRSTGYVLGARTAQLNGPLAQGDDCAANQLATWSDAGFFDEGSAFSQDSQSGDPFGHLPRLVALDDESSSPEAKVRSYLDSNCSNCHRPDESLRADWDARIETPLSDQNVLEVAPVGASGDEDDLLIAPGNPEDSLIFKRALSTHVDMAMPPIGRSTPDEAFVRELRKWIEELD